MIEGVEESELEAALERARKLQEHAEEAAAKAPPELARVLRRSAHSMVYNLEKALELLQQEKRCDRQRPVMYS